jgi:lysophospholipase L1-like esterase
MFLLLRDHWLPASSQARDSEALQRPRQGLSTTLMGKSLDLGPRHQLTYQQWVALLAREAEVTAAQQPKRLTILAGDSLSLWFPNELLPTDRHWLNQGISGETSTGLLKRLDLFDETHPEVIFVMIGINDLIRGVNDEVILANQRQILRYLRRVHPQARIVAQSILPHGGTSITWEGRDRLLKIPNSRIRRLNQQLAAIANEEGSAYLDLYPLFMDEKGDLRSDLTTDGLHLNSQGYLVWRAALQVFNQLQLQPSIKDSTASLP